MSNSRTREITESVRRYRLEQAAAAERAAAVAAGGAAVGGGTTVLPLPAPPAPTVAATPLPAAAAPPPPLSPSVGPADSPAAPTGAGAPPVGGSDAPAPDAQQSALASDTAPASTTTDATAASAAQADGPKNDAEIERLKAAARAALTVPKRFKLVRHVDVSGVSGQGPVAFGCTFPDGATIMRWCKTEDTPASENRYDAPGDAEKIHSHGGATSIVWIDE